jgi:hypothetical protein
MIKGDSNSRSGEGWVGVEIDGNKAMIQVYSVAPFLFRRGVG